MNVHRDGINSQTTSSGGRGMGQVQRKKRRSQVDGHESNHHREATSMTASALNEDAMDDEPDGSSMSHTGDEHVMKKARRESDTLV